MLHILHVAERNPSPSVRISVQSADTSCWPNIVQRCDFMKFLSHFSNFIWDFEKLPFPLHLGNWEKNPKNTQNWENKDNFWIGNDSIPYNSHISRAIPCPPPGLGAWLQMTSA